MPMSVLFLTDDSELFQFADYLLSVNGIKATFCSSVREATDQTLQGRYDTVIACMKSISETLIVELAKLKRDSEPNNCPLLVVLPNGHAHEHVSLLKAGLTDYVTRPFSPDYLVKYVNALRSGMPKMSLAAINNHLYIYANDVVIEMEGNSATVAGKDLGLGGIELNILTCLAKTPGKVFSRGEIIRSAWPEGIYVEERTVDVHIGHLRRCLRTYAEGGLIQTIRSEGYALVQSIHTKQRNNVHATNG